MNNPLTNLGESLAGAFRERMTPWLALESSLPEDSLSASLALADDILRLEETWELLLALNQVLETGFMPEDLFIVSKGAPVSPEQAPSAPHSGGGLENYPFTETPWHAGTGYRQANVPAEVERRPADDWASSQLPDDSSDVTGVKRQPFSYPAGGYPSLRFPEDQDQLGEEISSPDVTGIMGRGLLMSDAVWNSMVLNPDDSTTPVPSPTEVTNTDSFWRQPLQNLGDFATRITYPATEQSENVKTRGPVGATTPVAGLLTNDPMWLTHNKPGYSTRVEWPAAQEQPILPIAAFKTPPIPGQAGLLTSATPTTDFQPENQTLYPITPQRAPSPDTDDLLEALTELILRDFRRFYP